MVTYRQRGTVVTDHVFGVPLDHDRHGGKQISTDAATETSTSRTHSITPFRCGSGAGVATGRDSGEGAISAFWEC